MGICVDLAEPIEDLFEVKLNQLFFPHGWDCLLAALGKLFAGLPLLTSTQAQILNLLEGFAGSYDAAWAGLLKILKGQKRHGITVAQRRYVWRLHWEELP